MSSSSQVIWSKIWGTPHFCIAKSRLFLSVSATHLEHRHNKTLQGHCCDKVCEVLEYTQCRFYVLTVEQLFMLDQI